MSHLNSPRPRDINRNWTGRWWVPRRASPDRAQSSAPVPRLDHAPQEPEALEVCFRVQLYRTETKSLDAVMIGVSGGNPLSCQKFLVGIELRRPTGGAQRSSPLAAATSMGGTCHTSHARLLAVWADGSSTSEIVCSMMDGDARTRSRAM